MKKISASQCYERIMQLISPEDYEPPKGIDRILSESIYNKRSLKFFLNRATEEAILLLCDIDDSGAYEILVDAVGEYLHAYPAPATVKMNLYETLYKWCEEIAWENNISGYEGLLEELQKPVEYELPIEIIKALHVQDGVTKENLEAKYVVSSKKIQNIIHQISGENRENPLRIGGQVVNVPVSHHKEERRDEKRRFYTPNTMSPVIFQLNIMQVAALLQSFQYNYQEKGNAIPLDMAIDTWSQLSDYAKERVREKYCQSDPEFANFLDLVEAESTSLGYRFMDESELLARGNLSASEQIHNADKGDRICNIELMKPYRTRKNQRVRYDDECGAYYAVDANKLDGDRLYFTEEELKYLYEVD